MAYARTDGIETRYEHLGSGPPLLMMAHGGFNSVVENWTEIGAWKEIHPLDHFPQSYTCIAYDRRESGRSGGRLEAIDWEHYARQAVELLDHLEVEEAFILGGCMACNLAAAFAVRYPDRTRALVLHWPTGGVRWRMYGEMIFAEHIKFLSEGGLPGIVELARTNKHFMLEPAAGPWASVIEKDETFAQHFLTQDQDRYRALAAGTCRNLFDRDTSPGAEPEELMALKIPALVIPGRDEYHATSAARYMEECLPLAEYYDVSADKQQPDEVREAILSFLGSH